MRPFGIWSTYFICLALVLGSLAWFARRVIILEREQWQSIAEEHAAELQQRALWRMEYAIGPLLIQEASRPYYEFSSYHIGDRPAPPQIPRRAAAESMAPSRVIAGGTGFVKLHFQYGVDESVTSPQVPLGSLEEIAYERNDTTREAVAAAREALAKLEKAVRYFSLKRLIINIERAEQSAPDRAGLVTEQPSLEITSHEWRARARQLETNEKQIGSSQRPAFGKGSPSVSSGSMRALWCGDFLLLARHVVVDGEPLVQGCWLDREHVEARLLSDIRTLLPRARLVVRDLEEPLDDETGLALVSLPFRLEPGEIPVRRGDAGSAARTSLYLAIACALFAAFAVGFVLRIQIATSERRAEFVSAVTHELRTPLTTLRMYAEMLADGRVRAERQPTYFATLKRESDRLTSLVENVLSYSRVESNRKTPRCEPLALGDLLARVTERSLERARRAGMQLEVVAEDPSARVQADPGAVEQIVFNLVDNACKYAGEATDKRIELRARATANGGCLVVRDFGPGIDARAARQLFQPFQRPERAETSTKPGVGLGLALCRKLARSMHGDLRYDAATNPGASFTLDLAAG